MPDEPPMPGNMANLLAPAERCRRLAGAITDRQARERLLEMAEECEARAAELRKQPQ